MSCSGTFVWRGRAKPWVLLRSCVISVPWLFSAGVTHAQNVTNTASLAFGTFTVTGAGTISVSPAGSRTQSGQAWLLQAGSAGSAAQFTLKGKPNTVFALTFSANGSALLSDGAGHSMALQAFTHDAGAMPITSQNGTAQFNVGATLVATQRVPRGAYSGSFSLTVNYQ